MQSSPQHSPQLGAQPPPAMPPFDAAQAQAMITQLQVENQQLQAMGNHWQQELVRVSQKSIAVGPAPKIPLQKTFNGESTGAVVDEWIDSLEKHIHHYSSHLDDDKKRIDYAVMHLDGKANHWWKSVVSECNAQGRSIATWQEFCKVLRRRYQPIEATTLALANLDRLKQTGSVQSYTDYFYKQIGYVKEMSPLIQVHTYARGLKDAVKIEVIRRKPTTIEEAVICASQAEAFLNVSMSRGGKQQFSSGWANRGSSNQGSSGSSGSSSSSAMDVSNVNMGASGGSSGLAYSDSVGSKFSHDDDDEYSIPPPPRFHPDDETTNYLLAQVESLKQQLASSKKTKSQLNAMFGASSSKGGKVPGLSYEDYQRCVAEKRCLNCKQVGHVKSQCTNKLSLKF